MVVLPFRRKGHDRRDFLRQVGGCLGCVGGAGARGLSSGALATTWITPVVLGWKKLLNLRNLLNSLNSLNP